MLIYPKPDWNVVAYPCRWRLWRSATLVVVLSSLVAVGGLQPGFGSPGTALGTRLQAAEPPVLSPYIAPLSRPPGVPPLTATGWRVSHTLDLCTNTLYPGNDLPTDCPGLYPDALAYDSGKGEAFVLNEHSDNVSVVSDATNKVVASIPVGTFAQGIVYDRGKGEIFVSNYGSNNVTVISDATNKAVASIPLSVPLGLDYDSGKGEVFVADGVANNVSIVSDSTNKVVAGIPVGPNSNPDGVAYDSGKGEIFVSNENAGNVSIISDATDKIVASVAAGTNPDAEAYDSAKGEVFVGFAFVASSSVSVISDSKDSMLTTVSGLGYAQSGIAYDSATGQVLVSNLDSDNVSVISDATNTVTAGIAVGSEPTDLVVDSGNGEVLVTNAKSGTLSILTPSAPTGGPTISSFMASPSTLSLGESTTFTVTASGGTGVLGYAYAGLPSGCSSADSDNLVCTPSESGTFSVRAYVNDTVGNSANDTTVLTVSGTTGTGGMTISSFLASPNPVSVDQSTTFIVISSGGTPPYVYTYTGLPPGCASSNSPTMTCTPSTAGGYVPRVFVNDSAGHYVTTTTTLTVTPNPQAQSGSSGFLGFWGVAADLVVLGVLVSTVVAVVVALYLVRKSRSSPPPPPPSPGPVYPPANPPPPLH